MRTTYYLFIVLALNVSCTNDTNTTVISVLEDTTEDDFLVRPKAEEILPLFDLDTDPWQGRMFRYGELNDLHHNGRSEVSIGHEHPLLGNELERRADVDAFRAQITTILDRTLNSLGKSHSTIWEPIVAELMELQGDTLQPAILYVYSDLRENADWFSVYSYPDYLLKDRDIERVARLFLDRALSVRANGKVKVIVVHQPKDRREDASFSQMVTLYRRIFNELQIPIEFVTNLNTQAL